MELIELFKQISRHFDAWKRCVKNGNKEWEEKHEEIILKLLVELPHGSGIDAKWGMDFEKSKPDKLIFYNSLHVMKDGYYQGWIDFTLTVKPSLMFGFDVKISGKFGRYQYLREWLYSIFQ